MKSPLRRSGLLSAPLTFAMLASSACGGSVSNGGATQTDAGTGDGATTGDGGTVGPGDASPDVGPGASPPGLLAVPLFSCTPPVYTAAVTLGGSQQFQMNIDTGSTTLGVASNQCSSCGVTPVYTPGSSATDQHQTAMSQYGSGQWTGEIYHDSVTLSPAMATPMNLVAIDTQMGFFQPIQCDSQVGGLEGILGLGPGASALPGTDGYLDQLVATAKIPDVFATMLCDTGGTLWLGGYDPTFTTAAPQYTPMDTGFVGQHYYAVNLASITVNGKTVAVEDATAPGSVVDTGTSAFLLGSAAYTGLTAAIQGSAAFQKVFGASFFPAAANSQQMPACATVTESKAALDAALPPLTLTFGSSPGISVQAAATESYLFQYQTYWCSSLIGADTGLSAIIGSPVLRSNVVIWDRAQQRVGFAPHKACP
jgi:hypothetical protein